MGSVKVAVYGRIKPRQRNTQIQDYKLKYGDYEDVITIPISKAPGKREFRFKKIFGEDATQKQIFETVAKPVIKNVFEGYNGTIFTYGQTGSGKTHTMTGSLEDWAETGLIPRTVQEVFQMKERDTVISITYFEIYNEHVYDLIRADRVDSDFQTDSQTDDNCALSSFRNLSVHTVRSACEALVLYRRGDANKMVAETSSNVRSSRSHVIFSIGFEFPHPKEEVISLKPVLYLVDLAGSERISKTKNPMANPWETRYINLSLHYLEQVLVALRQPGRAHIPYRNSLMTALLRNSLGGNCITAMIATFSMSFNDMDETMQTCRFAERIALIKNEVKLSELASPQKEIESLKKENERLKNQLKLISNEQIQDQLTEKDKERCSEMVQNFLRDDDFFSLPLTDVRRMEFCFYLMRKEILKKKVPFSREFDNKNSADETIPNEKINLETKSSVLAVQPLLSDENNLAARRKRNPLELPKVNITYKRWKSTEQLSGTLTPKKVSSKGCQSFGNVDPKTPNTSSDNECGNRPNECAHENDIGVTVRPRSSNLGMKLSGESKKKGNINFISINSNDYEKLDPPSICFRNSYEMPINVNSRCKRSPLDESTNYTEVQIDVKIDVENAEKKAELYRTESKEKFSANCVPLTGDKEVDEEILKFYKSRFEKLKNNAKNYEFSEKRPQNLLRKGTDTFMEYSSNLDFNLEFK